VVWEILLTMRNKSIYNWFTEEKVSHFFTNDEISLMKYEYEYFYNDTPYPPEYYELNTEIEISSSLPLIQEYYEYLMENIDYSRADNMFDYMRLVAENKLKAHILDGCQTLFGIPLWETPNGLDELSDAIKSWEKYMEAHPQEIMFVDIFPVITKKEVVCESQIGAWVLSVLKEFYDFAEDNMIYSTQDERREECVKSQAELKRLEDLLLGKK